MKCKYKCGETMDEWGLCPSCDETCTICDRMGMHSVRATDMCDMKTCRNDICPAHTHIIDTTIMCNDCYMISRPGVKQMNNQMYRMEYVPDDDMAHVCAVLMGYDNHAQYQHDVGDTLVGTWFPLSETEYPPVVGWVTRIPIVCVCDNRSYGGECAATVTSYGVYVNIETYVDATT